uniref:Uncharacterized protein n=1 Tax=Anguilla anguilla TaxID=7936 RepID=A0A0E9SMJ5_ANGAN
MNQSHTSWAFDLFFLQLMICRPMAQS